jgi:hypothetical protein
VAISLGSQGLVLHLCEYASSHPDGTFSIIRGGIDNWFAASLPLDLVMWVLMEAAPGTLPRGPQEVHLELKDARESLTISRVLGRLEVQDPEVVTRLAVPVQGSIQQFGSYAVKVKLGPLSGTGRFEVKPAPKPGQDQARE